MGWISSITLGEARWGGGKGRGGGEGWNESCEVGMVRVRGLWGRKLRRRKQRERKQRKEWKVGASSSIDGVQISEGLVDPQ